MHLTNYHFYPYKNNLYSRPVKGLRGCEVGYSFAFNGQEKDEEIAGEGNINTAEFWEYDTRLGRRWNVDPVVKIHESPYAVLANNPIYIIDKNGADSTIYVNFSGSGLTTKQQNKAVNQLRKVYEESGVKSLKVVVTSESWKDIKRWLNSTDQFVDFVNVNDKNVFSGTGQEGEETHHTSLNIYAIEYESEINGTDGNVVRFIGNLMAHETGHGFIRRAFGGKSPKASDGENHNDFVDNIMMSGGLANKRGLSRFTGSGPTSALERFTDFDAKAIQNYLSNFCRNPICQYFSPPSELYIIKDIKYYVDNKNEKIR